MSSLPAALPQAIVAAMRSVLPAGRCGLHEPEIAGNEWAYVKECLDTGWVSSVGSYVDRIEKDLATYTGAARAVAVVNGTAALHVALHLAGVRAGDEVLMPSLTFVATANAAHYLGAIPHFMDAEPHYLGLDIPKLAAHLDRVAIRKNGHVVNRETGRVIRALVCMHTYGHPVDLDPLVELCAAWGLKLIEDAAESLGSLYKGRHTGNHGLISTLSFNGNKIVTTGGGGAILTNDPALADRAKHLTTTAKQPHKWDFVHDEMGFNYRLPNLNAAMGCAQLEQLPSKLERKRALAASYAAALAGLSGLRFLTEPDFARSNYWLNVMLLDDAALLEPVLDATNAAGLQTRPAWRPMHLLAMHEGCPRMDLSTTEDVAGRLINIPSSPQMAGEP
ncbi:DegT/DnrJ/EryC1/StrS aminotransferase [Paramagnetospirillum caucaseum]|uniref:GDP-perosamine synthase n=1 Tax=Paramagnetospirillum caucaseum TaxID=1244869 RepID=M2Y8D8_9PROT|nr:LegC family aminotransferase [Paramagnetospirillum caucaseum]EME69316.1 DegT/DnrJ/EryC1/StrS aminotransferase [Paramagnetospirillum caucaseum]